MPGRDDEQAVPVVLEPGLPLLPVGGSGEERRRLGPGPEPGHTPQAGPGERLRAQDGAPWETQARRQRHSEVTVPYLTLGGERRRLDAALQDNPPARLQCEIQAGGQRLTLELEQNENLLPDSHRLMFYLPNGTVITDTGNNPVNCYYHGTVRGFPRSSVSVSLCSGMRGVLVLSPNRSYGIEPLPADPGGVHLLYRMEGVRFNAKRCAVGPGQEQPTHPPLEQPPHRRRRGVLTESKYVELVMVADSKEYHRYGSNLKAIQMRMLEITNQVDAFYRPLSIRVALVGVEVWTQEDPFEVSRSPGDTLNRFLKWRETHLVPRIHHDNAQLLIGSSFPGGTVGMASQSSMCSKDRSGGVSVDHSVSVLAVASTVAHELGHNLGISHDTDDRQCTCQNPRRLGGCIMEPSTGFLPGQAFSSCSQADVERTLQHGEAMCLFNFPTSGSLYGGQRCGNLYLEDGEECDCGLADECKDPCCNATTCKLAPGAQCSSDGACCENCKLKRVATLCRPPLGDCDLPEYCTGVSPYCPPNVFLRNGLACDGERAYCYNGACLTLQAQCEVLWGPGSVQAPDICFSVNTKGDIYGNCGEFPNGTFLSCSEEDTKCGKLQCEGGNDRPVLGSNAKILVTNVRRGGQEYSCRGTHFNLGDDIADPAMVMPGTVCGQGKACIGRRCQDVSAFGVEECLRKCNSHGVCNSNDNCHCDAGWAPPYCTGSGYGGSVDSGPVQETQANHALVVAMLLVFLFAAGAALLCYLKRDVVWRELQRLRKGPQRHRDSRVENGSQAPSGGRMRYKPPDRIQTELRPAHTVKPKREMPGRPPPVSKPLPRDPAHRSSQPLPVRKPSPPRKPLPRDPGPRPVAWWSASGFEEECIPDHCRPPTRPPPAPPGKESQLPPLPSASS
ncbi:disintegrin and metalloproteinase domain-containing protein 12 isoform X2 [Pristis pectinata]|uniref:disintegrin and metalloproteinase domain-containing protein 12 isoform X2 n=1 Tax=Pristis pectinata TaxID=685728 RepID=UPI00223E81D2|nr:disintegrin and metalloproteinase domain-containing protein 12 isoform X2 [Pristis pectinata]